MYSAAVRQPEAIVALLAASIAASGCVSVAQRRAATTAQALKQNKGIVVVSPSTDSPCEFGASYLDIMKPEEGISIMDMMRKK